MTGAPASSGHLTQARSGVRVWAEDLRAGRLPQVSPVSGEAATASRRFRYSTAPPWTPLWTALFLAGILSGLGWIPVVLIHLGVAKRAAGPVHLTPAEIASIRNREIAACLLLAATVGLIAPAFVLSGSSDAWAGPLVVLALLALLAAVLFLRARLQVPARVSEPEAGRLAVEILDAHPSFGRAVALMYGSIEKSAEWVYFRSDRSVGDLALSWNSRGPYGWEIRDSDIYGDYLLARVDGYKVRVYQQPDPSLYEIDVLSPVGASKAEEKAWREALDAVFENELIPAVGNIEAMGFSRDRRWWWTGSAWRPISEYHGEVPPTGEPGKVKPAPDGSGTTPRYPVPDRSNIAPDLNEGSLTGWLAGNRPYRIESWSQDHNHFVTVFFSVLEIEEAQADALLALVEPVLSNPLLVEPERRHLEEAEVHRITDAGGNEMYSLTFVAIRAGDE